MSKRLLALNLVLVAAAVVFSFQLVRVFTTPRALPKAGAPRPLPPTSAASEEKAPAALPTYGVIATKNLFSPTRSEAPAAAATQVPPAAKPMLFGVVIDNGRNTAFLEDPATKRVFGYKLGDAVAGGQLALIEADRVVIKRGEGTIEVLLRDPAKPKAVASTPAPSPRQTAPGVQQPAHGPPAVQPPPPVPPPSRVFPPNVRGRPRGSVLPPAGHAPTP
jgi:hypothetical protein